MSSKNIQIPYQILAQGEQTISYTADTLYCQTMNAPADITLDLYLNNSKVEEKTIKPNYEMNLDNINIDEVIVKLTDNETNFTPTTSISLAGLSGTIYQISATDEYIYVMTSTNFYQLNLDGSVYNNYAFSSLPISPITITNTLQNTTGNHFVIYNGKIYILLISNNDNSYLCIFDINCNFLNNINVNINYPYFTGIHIYNDKIFIGLRNAGKINIYNLNGSLLQIFSVSGYAPIITFSKNIVLSYDVYNFYQYSLDTLNLITSISLPNNDLANIDYSSSINSIFFICFPTVTLMNIFLISGNKLILNTPVVISANAYLCSFVKNGYLVLLTTNGLSIYNQSLKLIYSNSFSTTYLGYQYLTYNSSNIYYISGVSTLNILNYNIKQPVNNPLYPADFNLILGCKC